MCEKDTDAASEQTCKASCAVMINMAEFPWELGHIGSDNDETRTHNAFHYLLKNTGMHKELQVILKIIYRFMSRCNFKSTTLK